MKGSKNDQNKQKNSICEKYTLANLKKFLILMDPTDLLNL
jgi:hypothetical protein